MAVRLDVGHRDELLVVDHRPNQVGDLVRRVGQHVEARLLVHQRTELHHLFDISVGGGPDHGQRSKVWTCGMMATMVMGSGWVCWIITKPSKL